MLHTTYITFSIYFKWPIAATDNNTSKSKKSQCKKKETNKRKRNTNSNENDVYKRQYTNAEKQSTDSCIGKRNCSGKMMHYDKGHLKRP